MGPTWGPPGSCRPQTGPMLAHEPCYQGILPFPTKVMRWFKPNKWQATNWTQYDQMLIHVTRPQWVNTLRPRQHGRHFPDNIFKCTFLNENVQISIEVSMKFVPRIPINNILALVQIMAWCRLCDKPLSEPMMDSLPMHICITRPQWVNSCLPAPKLHAVTLRTFSWHILPIKCHTQKLYSCGPCDIFSH